MRNRRNAEKVVNEHVLWSVGGGLIPIPLADLVAVTALQTSMLEQLSNLYGVQYTGSMAKALVSGLAGSAVARIGASALKAIPGVGTTIGGLTMSIASGASTYAVGKVAINHFEGGGTWGNFDIDAARNAYQDAYEEGKQVAKKLKEEEEEA